MEDDARERTHAYAPSRTCMNLIKIIESLASSACDFQSSIVFGAVNGETGNKSKIPQRTKVR